MATRTLLRPFSETDLAALVTLWNHAFSDRRNFHPINAEIMTKRVLQASATDPAGLFLAWHEAPSGDRQLVGLVHAFRPPPRQDLYRNWTPNHYIALLYVKPDVRRQGIGGQLLQAAENWLYYCPVHFASQAQPVYGMVEGPRPPVFGSTERMGISAADGVLIEFLAKRGYVSVDVGDVSMAWTPSALLPRPALPPAVAALGLRPITFSNHHPFQGSEASRLPTVSIWGENDGYPYGGVGLVDGDMVLRGHLAWYPMAQAGKIALINFRVDPSVRHQGAGSFLLDWGLHEMIRNGDRNGDPVRTIELHTHLKHNADAVALYRRRGFDVVDVWINLVKT